MEKWIVTREIHMGYLKRTIYKGNVIEYEEEKKSINIDGDEIDDLRDFKILKKHGFIIPYAEEELEKQEQAREQEEREIEERRQKFLSGEDKVIKREKLPVIQDDSDEHPMIDISHTIKKTPDGKKKDEKMTIIKADQDAEERLVEQRQEMEIVQDDTLGDVDTSATPLNSGVKTFSKEEYAKIKEENEKKASKPFVDPRLKVAADAVDSVKHTGTGVVDNVEMENSDSSVVTNDTLKKAKKVTKPNKSGKRSVKDVKIEVDPNIDLSKL